MPNNTGCVEKITDACLLVSLRCILALQNHSRVTRCWVTSWSLAHNLIHWRAGCKWHPISCSTGERRQRLIDTAHHLMSKRGSYMYNNKKHVLDVFARFPAQSGRRGQHWWVRLVHAEALDVQEVRGEHHCDGGRETAARAAVSAGTSPARRYALLAVTCNNYKFFGGSWKMKMLAFDFCLWA